MLIVLKKSYALLSLVLAAAIFFSTIYFGTAKEEIVTDDTIIIDAGHGGIDGGAEGGSGVLEKNINLAIAMKLRDIAKKDGKAVIMTRETDTDLSTTESEKVRTQKRSDLQNRKKIIEDNPNAIYVGIHQNKFEQSKYRGAQVFYADNTEAERLGQCVQKSLIEGLNDGNTRVAKKTNGDIYILKGIKTPAVIVECGFLSNPEEEQLLTKNDYQTKVAQAIYDGICSYKE